MRFAQALVLAASTCARLDVQLQTADPVWPLMADDSRRHQVPSQLARKHVGCYFALVQRAVGKVAQRDLPAAWLVHAVAARAVLPSQQRGERVVRPPGDQLNT